MGMIKEFKDFAIKGNVIDLAVGVVIGAAFGKIISSLIEHVITPLLLQPALKAAHLTDMEQLTFLGSVKYGMFLSAIINFLMVAWILFLIIKGINAAKKKEAAAAPPPPTAQEQLLIEIRDLLKEQNNPKS